MERSGTFVSPCLGRLQELLRAGKVSKQTHPSESVGGQTALWDTSILLLSSSLHLMIKRTWCLLLSVSAALSCLWGCQVGKSCLPLLETQVQGLMLPSWGRNTAHKSPWSAVMVESRLPLYWSWDKACLAEPAAWSRKKARQWSKKDQYDTYAW